MVEIEFDPAKDEANLAKHGISLARAAEFDIATLAIVPDPRFDEERYRLYGLLDGEPYCLAATLFGGVVRAISLRRAHLKEYQRHVR